MQSLQGLIPASNSLDQSAHVARFVSDDLAESQSYIRRHGVGHSLRSTHGAKHIHFSHWNLLRFENTLVDFVIVECPAGYEVDRTSNLDCYMIHLPISGTCEVYRAGAPHSFATFTAGQVFAVNPSQRIRKRWTGGCRQIMMSIRTEFVERLLADEFGVGYFSPPRFDVSVIDVKRSAPLVDLILSYSALFKSSAEINVPALSRSVEKALVCGLLTSLPHDLSSEIQSSKASFVPQAVRRVVDHIHLNFGSRVAPRDLAKVSGGSLRSLYYGFKRWHSTTPMVYLRNVRLSNARKSLLSEKDLSSNVSQIAFDVGYESLSHFARDYRKKFGELPSETLRKKCRNP